MIVMCIRKTTNTILQNKLFRLNLILNMFFFFHRFQLKYPAQSFKRITIFIHSFDNIQNCLFLRSNQYGPEKRNIFFTIFYLYLMLHRLKTIIELDKIPLAEVNTISHRIDYITIELKRTHTHTTYYKLKKVNVEIDTKYAWFDSIVTKSLTHSHIHIQWNWIKSPPRMNQKPIDL